MSEEIKKIINQIEDRLALHITVKEPVSKDLDRAIKLSVAYKELLEENKALKQVLNEIREYSLGNIQALENRLNIPFCNFEKATKELMIHKNYYELITGEEYENFVDENIIDEVLGDDEK